MGRFPLSRSGRKKQQAQAHVQAQAQAQLQSEVSYLAKAPTPTSKVHRLLGTGTLDVGVQEAARDKQASRINIRPIDDPWAVDSSDSDSRDLDAISDALMRSQRQWGDRSERRPQPLKPMTDVSSNDDEYRGTATRTPLLRAKQSVSTIRSAHDGPMPPYTITHQASSSSMGQVMSSKAYSLLDMDNTCGTTKAKKKPARLDLSGLLSRHSHNRTEKAPHASPEELRSPPTESPHPSAHSPNSFRKPRKLQKKSTHENLQVYGSMDSPRPGTAGKSPISGPFNASHVGIDSLYEHYEQMSLRQLMDLENDEEGLETQPSTQHKSTQQQEPSFDSSSNPSNASPHDPIEPVFEMVTRRSQPLQQPDSGNKSVDSATSVSSRHTRTSKASKRTDQSIQGSDFQEKSVLLLSSDSEDDDVSEAAMISPTATVPQSVAQHYQHAQQHFQYLAGDIDDYKLIPDPLRPMAASASNYSADSSSARPRKASKSGRSSRSSSRMSFAPALPSSGPQVPMQSASNASRASSAMTGLYKSNTSTSRASVLSSSTAYTNGTWQSNLVHDKDSSNMHNITTRKSSRGQSIVMTTPRHANDSESSSDGSQTDTSARRASSATTIDSPYASSKAHTSTFDRRPSAASKEDESDGQSRLIAVSHSEEMLLSALRQRRQMNRDSRPAVTQMEDPISPRSHQTKASEATITEADFDFDFPAPPVAAPQPRPEMGRGRRSSEILRPAPTAPASPLQSRHVPAPIYAPAPTRPLPTKGILRASQPSTPDPEQHSILMFLEKSPGTISPYDEPEPSPDLSDFLGFEPLSPESDYLPSEYKFYLSSPTQPGFHRKLSVTSPQRNGGIRTSTAPARHSLLKNDVYVPPPAVQKPNTMGGDLNEQSASLPGTSTASLDVPRPDSPISPDAFPAVPTSRVTLNKLARLSAVGPTGTGNGNGNGNGTVTEPGWWGDSD